MLGGLTHCLAPLKSLEGFFSQGPGQTRRGGGLQPRGPRAPLPSTPRSEHRPRQAAASSAHPWVVVSTTQVDD